MSLPSQNNLTALRLLLALAVLISHAWPLLAGPGVVEPLVRSTGASLGMHAVRGFFFLSGFLITASLMRRPALGDFLLARAVRLLPALIVANLVAAFGIGAAMTGLPLATYLTAYETWVFVLQNSLILAPIYALGDVFATNPYPTVHGSIWSLRHEVLCYALLLGAHRLGALRHRWAWRAFCLVAVLSLIAQPQLPKILQIFLPLGFCFGLGSLVWIYRNKIRLSFAGVLLTIGTALALRQLEVRGFVGFEIASQALALGYTMLWLGLALPALPGPRHVLGDYSYGTYLYAFPIQGLVVALVGVTSPFLHCLLAIPLTLFLAVLSWHLIEAPSLRYAHRFRRRRDNSRYRRLAEEAAPP